MGKMIYVGNLALRATAGDLAEAFGKFGTVTGARVVSDRETGRSRGFGFVEMGDGGSQAIAALDGAALHGRALAVSEASPCAGGDRRRPGCRDRRVGVHARPAPEG
jgi:RNA recognition motif-containing protein